MSINNSDVDKNIRKAAAILKIAYYPGKNENTTAKDYEKEVITKYGGIFSNQNLSNQNLSNNNLMRAISKVFLNIKIIIIGNT